MSLKDGFRFGEDRRAEPDGHRDALPEFGLTYLFSSRDHRDAEPDEITILPPTNLEENYTEWISADAKAAIDIREVA